MAQLHGMTGGEGPLSYAHNSSYQRSVMDVVKPIIEEEITKKLDITQLSSNGLMDSLWIADFGCSTGHNSFLAMQMITKAIENRFQSETSMIDSPSPEFYVFFNDHVKNDFNTLFRSLPSERHYQAAGLPGNFQERLLPKASLHFAFSSWALHWLSQVPKAVTDPNSPAWNKGKIGYVGARQEVYDAYSNQFAKDIESFLEARAQELVSGGLMALLVPAYPKRFDCSNPFHKEQLVLQDRIGSILMDMAKKRAIMDVVKPMIEEEITMKLHITQLSSNASFWISDFGCSTGLNSFLAMHIITKAIQNKFQSETSMINSQSPEFYVLFNDHDKNDFNTLFRSLPPERHYQAVGLPGNFYKRLLPKASLHFAYSSWALHWLSQVPKAVTDPNSPAWNKGKVGYVGARQEVYDAFSNQFAKDIESFLEARAQELVSGGLMALLVPAFPIKFDYSNPFLKEQIVQHPLDSILMDMAKKGRLSEAKIDFFNFPMYFTFPEEMKMIIERNDSYSIERMEILDNPGKYAITSVCAHVSLLRAIFEELLASHFGSDIIDEVFDTYTQKLEVSPALLLPENDKTIMIFVLLKRRVE
ncbi:UNVERIFIED_CONTAM: Loganic acid O-methyltransferase [Sesamum latifolium]|uniref:Loganic acid O-methyltransferase n=1 Tax=Sesamum latifolium TaxID=2727402 RepID=A0AAW2YCD7_9LAMI